MGAEMIRTDGQSSRLVLRRENPHQVLVLADSVRGRTFNRVLAFHDQANVRIKNCTVRKDDKWYLLYCFAERNNATAFHLAFGGELFDHSSLSSGLTPTQYVGEDQNNY